MKSFIKLNLGILFLALLAFSSCRNPDNEILPTCFDEVLNQGEERIDCGGPNCPPCLPSCDDGVQNQDEQTPVLNGQVIAIDCGGENCAPCSTCNDGIQNAHWVKDPNLTPEDIGKADVGQGAGGQLYRLVMETGIDCGFPCLDVCPPLPDDGIQNGDEQGIDCGGAFTPDCPTATCYDGIHNGLETGIDCGDPDGACPDCPDPTCDDGIKNTHIEITDAVFAGYIVVIETGIDCSNNILSTCPICPEATCFDGIQNGSETGIDCGGICETLCDPEPNCNNGIQDGDEEGVDCGGANCPICPTCFDGIKNGLEYDIDCLDYPIDHLNPPLPGFEGCAICPSCHDGVHNFGEDDLYELDVDCGGPNCPSCEQYVKVSKIGKGAGSSFEDQYTYNKKQALAGVTDTLSTDDLGYPGLKVERKKNIMGDGEVYLKITANQGIPIDDNNTYIKTVTLYLPLPEDYELGEAIPMLNVDLPDFFGYAGCVTEADMAISLPSIAYQEKIIQNNLADKCYRSYILDEEPSRLVFTYNFGETTSLGYYTKGNINQGSLRSAPDPITDVVTLGKFTNLTFRLQYELFPQ